MEKQMMKVVDVRDVKDVTLEESGINRLVIRLDGTVEIETDKGSIQRASDVYLIFRSLVASDKDSLVIRMYERIDEGMLKALFFRLPDEKEDTIFVSQGEDIYNKAIESLMKVKDKLLTEAML